MDFSASSEAQRLLCAGAYLASVKGHDAVTVTSAALDADIPLLQANALFPSDERFTAVLREFLVERMNSFISIDPEADVIDQLSAVIEGTFAFAEADKHAFDALMSSHWPMNEHPFEVLSDGLASDLPDPNWYYKRTTFMALTIGFAHLSAFGRVRLLLPVIKRQLLRAVIRITCKSLLTSQVENFSPTEPATIPNLVVAEDDTKARIFRAAIDEFRNYGADALTVDNAIRRAGFARNKATLFDGDVAFLRQLEEYIDNKVKESLAAEIAALGPEASALGKVKAAALGYINYGIRDPYGLRVLLYIASGSIVPGTRQDDYHQDDAFTLLMTVASGGITELGHSPNQWEVFEKSIAAWSFGHGAAMLSTVGFWREVSPEERWANVSGSIECILAALGGSEK